MSKAASGMSGISPASMFAFWSRSGGRGCFPSLRAWGLGADNELYNINADHMAAACAEFVEADHLIYLTDVCRRAETAKKFFGHLLRRN